MVGMIRPCSKSETPLPASTFFGRIVLMLAEVSFWEPTVGIVYLSQDLVLGKGYVGGTICTLDRRRCQHEDAAVRGDGYLFHAALRTFGFDMFEWSVLFEEDEDDWEVLGAVEMKYIRRLKTRAPSGYNLTDGGEGIVNLTEESKKRQVDSNRRRKYSLSTRRKIGESVAKLTGTDVEEIRDLYASGLTAKQIALLFNFKVTADNILPIVRGKSWKWVGGPIGIRRRGPIAGKSYPIFSEAQKRRWRKMRVIRNGKGLGIV